MKKITLKGIYYWMVGPRSRRNYWTCSVVSAWICRNYEVTKKPSAATAEEWNEWHTKNKGKPGYWLAEEGLDILQDIWMFIPDVYHRVRFYLRNRFVDRPHLLDTKLKPGEYYEFDTRLLHGMMEALVTFVEDEKASMQRWSSDEKFKLPNAEKGIEYLNWEMTLEEDDPDKPEGEKKILTRQAEDAKETLALYEWWKNIRPLRKEPGEVVGLWDFKESTRKDTDEEDDSIWRIMGRKMSPEDKKEYHRLMDESNRVETEQYQEDTDMMIRLIKMRRGLWT